VVVVAGEQALELEVVDLLLEHVELVGDRVERGGVVLRARELEQVLEVGGALRRAVVARDDAARGLQLADDLLRVLGAVPETRLAHAGLEPLDLVSPGVDVKDSLGAGRAWCRPSPDGVRDPAG
jgi:hypothetical protein